MKKGIHPKYIDCTIVCACGNTVHTHATKPNIHVEICSKCHPFYTGKQKLVDSAGRVERFKKRYESKKITKTEPVENVAEKKAEETGKKQKTQAAEPEKPVQAEPAEKKQAEASEKTEKEQPQTGASGADPSGEADK